MIERNLEKEVGLFFSFLIAEQKTVILNEENRLMIIL